MKILFAISGLAALVLAGCGGSGGSTLTKAQYDAKVSHLCLVAADQVHELHLSLGVRAWKVDGPRLVRIDKSFGDKLAALTPPAEIKVAAADFASANARVARDDRDAVAAADAGDAGKLRAAIDKANRDSTATFPAAKEIGATGCYIG